MKKYIALFMVVLFLFGLSGCKFKISSSQDRNGVTEDGIGYYRDRDVGICITSLPSDKEDVTIPKYIDGEEVKQIGYLAKDILGTYRMFVELRNVKHITIQHNVKIEYVKDWGKLETLTYIDWPLWDTGDGSDYKWGGVRIWGNYGKVTTEVKLKRSDQEYNLENFLYREIYLRKCVTEIEKDVFSGLDNIRISTEYDSKPDGWQDGWNGNCEVVWGVKFDT